MKKFLALFLTLTLLAGLTACKGREAIAEAQVVHVVTAPTDDATFVYEPEDPTQVLPGGQTIALVTGPGGTDSGEDAMLWQGVQTFANTYHYTAVSQTAAAAPPMMPRLPCALRPRAVQNLWSAAARSWGQALYRIQENYPDVHYLLFDDEPHNDDYSAYKTANLVHCVLFQEEQAGYLAGYAAVTEGYTALGFVGTREIPGIVRYATGFLQGAEAAAEQQGERVSLQTWFTDTDTVNDAITQRMIDWYNNGTTLIMVSGGDPLYRRCPTLSTRPVARQSRQIATALIRVTVSLPAPLNATMRRCSASCTPSLRRAPGMPRAPARPRRPALPTARWRCRPAASGGWTTSVRKVTASCMKSCAPARCGWISTPTLTRCPTPPMSH